MKAMSDFTPLDNAVRFGLTAIKGIGTTSVQAMIEARERVDLLPFRFYFPD